MPVSLATAGLWIVLFWFLSPSEAVEIAPLLIFVDAVVMSILTLGACPPPGEAGRYHQDNDGHAHISSSNPGI